MEQTRFDFGENWKDYISNTLDEERISAARNSLQRDFGVDNFSGERFIDVGSGSGLFSYCAYHLDASEIISFDYDLESVEATKKLHREAGEPKNWEVKQGDILDDAFVSSLPKADYVYAWGVVHHTGSLWDAIENTLSLTSEDGLCYITVYNRVESRRISDGQLTSEDWLRIKNIYNNSSELVKRTMEKGYKWLWALLTIKRGSSPRQEKENSKKDRGMALDQDIPDWLGGLPYEFASVGEICEFVLQNHSFVLEFMDEDVRAGNNLYRFRKENNYH